MLNCSVWTWSEELDLLDTFSESNLPSKVFEWLIDNELFEAWGEKITRKVYLYREWYINTTNENELFKYVKDIFEKYYKYEKANIYLWNDIDEDAINAYEDVTRLLVISWVAKLITAWDWSVNRLAMAEKIHWLQENGFEKLEEVLVKNYPNYYKPAHLHKWPWNWILPAHLLSRKSKNYSLSKWDEFGIWDQLYFPMEELLGRFIKDEYKDDINIKWLIEVLSAILKKILKEKWFKQNSASIRKWKQIKPFCDLNDIFPELLNILNSPEEYLSDVFDSKTWRIKSSVHFENDSTKAIRLELLWLLLRIEGKSVNETNSILSQKIYIFYKEKVKLLSTNILKLKSLRKSIINTTQVYELTLEPILKSKIIKEISSIWNIDIDSNIGNRELVELIVELVKLMNNEYEEEFIILKKLKNRNPKENINLDQIIPWFWKKISLYNHSKSTIDLFKTFFTKEFVHEVLKKKNCDDHKLDLNKYPNMHFSNFKQWYFTQIPELFKRKFLLISATRSDSHENDKQFEEDINKNLDMLQPWWCLLTDWVKESFSCVYRFNILTSILAKRWNEFKAEVIINSNNNNPKSILIQRRHPTKWYLTDEDKKKIFSQNIIFDSLKNVASRPYIYVITKLRKKILELTHDWNEIDIFNEVQKYIKNKVEKVLLEYWIEKYKNDYFIYIKETYNDIIEILKTYPELRKIILEKFSDIQKLDINFIDKLKGWYSIAVIEKLKEALMYHEIVTLVRLNKPNTTDINILNAIFIEQEWDIKWYIRQQIRFNSKTNILSKTDLKEIVTLIEEELEGVVHKCIQATRIRVKWTLTSLKPDKINIFTRLDAWISDINRRWNSVDASTLPNNEEFWNFGLEELLKDKKANFINKIIAFRKKIWIKPICIISYNDCITNNILLEKLKKLFWEEFCSKNIKIIGIWFRGKWKSSSDLVRHFDSIQNELNIYKENWWIIIWWWSWTDAYDVYWKAYKYHFWYDLLEKVEEEKSNLRVLNICLSYQIWADMIWKKHCERRIRTEPWMLEIGPTSITTIQNHAIFKWFPRSFTVAMTHSGHVKDTRENWNKWWKLNFIASSNATWLPVAYTWARMGKFDRIVWFQWHPEIDLLDDKSIWGIVEELRWFRSGLIEQFWVDEEAIEKNFWEIYDKNDIPYIKKDSGDFVLISSLEYLVNSINL